VRKRRRKHPVAPEAQLGLAWYTRAGWERLRELAADRDALDDSFEDWESGALAAIGELHAMGREVRKVPIDVEALAVRCGHHGRQLDSAARAAYVTHFLQAASED
jgi:hypothetical protein